MFQPIAAAVWFLLLTGWLVFYFVKMQPESGTLEWIQRYDKRSFSFLNKSASLTRSDWWWLGGCMLFCGGSWTLHQNATMGLAHLTLLQILLHCVCPAITAGGLYVLTQKLGAIPLIGALCVATYGFCFGVSDAAAPLVLSLLLFYSWMTQAADGPGWKKALYLSGAMVLTAAAIVLQASVLWLAAVELVLFIFVLVQRWQQNCGYRGAKVWRALLLGAVGSALLAMVVAACYVISAGLLPASDFPGAVFSSAFYHAIGTGLPDYLSTVLHKPSNWFFAIGLTDCGIFLPGLMGWIGVTAEMDHRKNAPAAFLFFLTAALGAAWLLGAGYLLPIAFILNVSLLCTNLWNRTQKIPALALPVLMLLLEFELKIIGL